MTNTIKIFGLACCISLSVLIGYSFKAAPDSSYNYKQFSTVESVVPGGLGRSRILSTDASGTTIEKDLQNFYSLTGINFGNITNNDKLIVDKINEYTAEGWELCEVTAGVQSSGERNGIFITRYLFKKKK
jgi:hypothetical protein